MNGIKNLALILVVVGVGYLVYQHLYGPSRAAGPESAGAPEMPKLEIPGWNRAGQKPSSMSSGPSAGAGSSILPAAQFVPTSRTLSGSALPDPEQKKPVSGGGSSESSSAKSGAKPSAEPAQSGNTTASEPAAKPASSDGDAKDSASVPPASLGQKKEASPTSEASAKPEVALASNRAGRRPDNEIGEYFIICMQAAHQAIQQGQWTGVLLQLSRWYRYPELTQAESDKLTELLDQLAGSVIYSREHLLEPPYRVRPGDNLVQIARQYQVSWELLAKINGIRDPYRLEGVEVLKVLRGPFHALVDLTRREITLMLEFRDQNGQIHPLYAGRFPIRAISGVSELEGHYEVLRKAPGPRAQQPGPLALELSQQVLIHGPAEARLLPKSRASLELPETDMEEIYDILTIGSRVLMRR
ncbi:MAG: LysM peptidoglycan-binding domain-containing protein [Thermoguttaceae bacterium]|nr:LysM peptidoglycan-binding domain-containing protein [Thermoguttaceae bacterium]MDW8036449.1 LysM peptidoglycan-binding domain-containing protein [Thermoguttaceae bacterium]